MLFERFKCFRSYFVPFFPSLYGYVEGHMTLDVFHVYRYAKMRQSESTGNL